MKTVTLSLGDKKYLAAKLTLAEFSEVTKTTSEIGANGNLSRLEELVRILAKIVCRSICKAGSAITVEEIADIASPEEISEAVGNLISLGTSPDSQVAGGAAIN